MRELPSSPARSRVDVAVIGGGFFGCRIAQHVARRGRSVVVVEQGDDIMGRASYVNQARVHQGYHYPRSILTALRSRVNFRRFVEEYPECVDTTFDAYYAIARRFSHVTARQFRTFCARIEAPIAPAPAAVRRLFDGDRIEDVFRVEEWVFDAVSLRARVRRDLDHAGVDVRLGTRAQRVARPGGRAVVVELSDARGPHELEAGAVLNCTYSGINRLLDASRLPIVPLKHETTEMALVDPPAELARSAVTVMCGPFFSLMPFPPRRLHTLSHVRYTPHRSWVERGAVAQARDDGGPEAPSHFERMVRDAARYLPCLARSARRGSLWEVKTVLPSNEHDDGRPILFRRDHGLPGLTCVMGGKIDNVYDALKELDEGSARRSRS